VEVIETDLLKDRDVQKFEVICDDRLKAVFVVDKKYVIGIEENAVLNCKKANKL